MARIGASLVLLLVAVLALSWAQSPCEALRFQRQHMSVNILNALPNAEVLHMHCHSRDNDLGEKTRLPGIWFGWGFEANVLGTTLFWCEFAAGTRTAGFTVFQDIGLWGKQTRWCRECVWVVQDDGFYRSENGVESPKIRIHTWN